MAGPGEYVADVTEGITRVEDLPKPKVASRSRNFSHRPCPECGHSCYRKRTFERTLHDVGDLVSGRPRNIRLTYSQHYCCKCESYFNADTSDLALPKSRYTHRVVTVAVRLVVALCASAKLVDGRSRAGVRRRGAQRRQIGESMASGISERLCQEDDPLPSAGSVNASPFREPRGQWPTLPMLENTPPVVA